jgi:CBS domain-containing protein
MTEGVRSVDAGADVADLARLFVDDRLRSVPVLEHGVLVGIVSRRDLLRVLVRPDEVLRVELLRLIEDYTAEPGAWEVAVTEGMATVRRVVGVPEASPEVEQRAVRALARTVPGVVSVRVLAPAGSSP